VSRAVSLGIAKVNVNTELRAAYFGALDAAVAARAGALDLRGLGEAVIDAVAGTVAAKLALLGWGGP
jgi:fructose/tagatose bisphosphate aldolase